MRAGEIALNNVIAPMTRERFVTDFWTKEHLVLKGAKGRFSPLLTWDELNEILEWHKPTPSSVRLFQEGRLVDPKHYIDGEGHQARLNAGGLVANISQGASLVMDNMEELAPRVGRLADLFQDVFQSPVIVNLYASWGQQNCFNLHWDPQEVFILQLSGRKHWKIYAPTRFMPLKDDPDQPAQPVGRPAWEGILEDGDMLYMPRGWWHMATPLEEASLHLNFSLEPPNGADFLRWWLPRLLKRAEVRQNLPLGCTGAVRQDYFGGLLKSLMAAGEGRDLAAEFMSEWNAYRRARPQLQLPLAPAAQKTPLGMTTSVRLAQRDGLFIECEPGARTAKFRAANRQFNVWPQIVPALKRLSSRQSVTVQELCSDIGDQQVVSALLTALEAMAGNGVILKDPPRAS